jgi:hypothetical protein
MKNLGLFGNGVNWRRRFFSKTTEAALVSLGGYRKADYLGVNLRSAALLIWENLIKGMCWYGRGLNIPIHTLGTEGERLLKMGF